VRSARWIDSADGGGDLVDVDHYPFADATGGNVPHPHNPHLIFRRRSHFGNEGAGFSGAYIQGHNCTIHPKIPPAYAVRDDSFRACVTTTILPT
jgi:hypothetical protein